MITIPKIIEHYIDNLTDEERDRIITAEAFKTGGGYKEGQKGGVKTYKRVKRTAITPNFKIGKVLEEEDKTIVIPETPTTGCLIDHAKAGTSTEGYATVGCAFDDFYVAHKDVAIRLIKEYAAKKNRIVLPKQAEREIYAMEG